MFSAEPGKRSWDANCQLVSHRLGLILCFYVLFHNNWFVINAKAVVLNDDLLYLDSVCCRVATV